MATRRAMVASHGPSGRAPSKLAAPRLDECLLRRLLRQFTLAEHTMCYGVHEPPVLAIHQANRRFVTAAKALDDLVVEGHDATARSDRDGTTVQRMTSDPVGDDDRFAGAAEGPVPRPTPRSSVQRTIKP